MRRVAEAGEAWVQGGREEADLLRGARLETASEWAMAEPGAPLDRQARVRRRVARRKGCSQSEGSAYYPSTPLARRRRGLGPRRRAHGGSDRRRATQPSDEATKPGAIAERLAATSAKQASAEARTASLGRRHPGQLIGASNPSRVCSSRSRQEGCSRTTTRSVTLRSRSSRIRRSSVGPHDPVAQPLSAPDGTRMSGGTSD